jgi:hypothetical protein
MDYSSISQDPAGASPWGSPRADRTTFAGAGTAEIPSSPLPPNPQSPYGDDRDHRDHRRQESPTPTGDEDVPSSPDLSERLQSAQLGDPDYVEQPPYATHAPYMHHPRPQAPARYQTGARQNVKPVAPTYRLQAKITALERTGKKDPIFRFDVYVGCAVTV